MGKDHVGDVPLTKKILAALTTGKEYGGYGSDYLLFLASLSKIGSLL